MRAARTGLFWDKVEQDGECWVWTAAKDPQGYGRVRIDGILRIAHRVAYESMIAEIPDGLVLDHLCRRHSCVNPYHLDPVTTRVNVIRGDGGASKTHCPRDHPYEGENLRVWRGRRYCRACQIARSREYRARKVAS